MEVEALLGFVAATGWRDIPDAVRHRAKLVLLDTLGVILAGSQRPEIQALQARLSGTAGTGASLLAPACPASDPRTAAMLNAIAGRSVELCEGTIGLQPAVHMLPALLAIAEQRGLSGEAMLEALVLGYEVAGRLGQGFTPRVFAHPNGQVSLLAAVAGGARLMGLDAAAISLATRVATTMLMTPSYTNTAAGGTTLNLPAGMAAFAAVLAPEMAQAGYFAKDDAIEEGLGTMVGAGFDPSRLAEGLGGSWHIAGGYFRFYACCNPIHPALDSLRECLETLRPAVADIERIEVTTFAFASVMSNAAPPNYFASKYSLPHAAATLIVRGGLGFAELDDSALEDPEIARVRPLVHIEADPAMTAKGPALKPARVVLMLRDGRRAEAACENSRRDTELEDPEAAVRAKFAELAGTVLTAAGVQALEHAVDRAETWDSMAVMTDVLRRHVRDREPV